MASQLLQRQGRIRDAAITPGIVARFARVTELVCEFGPGLGMPFVRHLGGGLYEIRVRAPEGHGRFLFCNAGGKMLVVLHSFLKKARKTPRKDLKLARQRMREVLQ